MNKIATLLLIAAAALSARSAETRYFRAVMLPASEVPPANIEASGAATIVAHIVRDDNGQVAEGSVDFLVNYTFPGATTFTGLHIHSGTEGTNGPVVINTGISAANPVQDAAGRGSIDRQGPVRPADTAALAALRGMLERPHEYYVNLHTTQFPGGAIRGQLLPAEARLFMGLMSPLNEVPAITDLAASGVGHVLVVTARDIEGAPFSSGMVFDVDYRFPEQVTFTGFHIHGGPAGVNAPVIFNTGIGAGAASVQSPASGAGKLRRAVDVNLNRAVEAEALGNLFRNPAGFYLNLHTTQYPGGAIRTQLRPVDAMTFQVSMLPGNEVPPLSLEASGPSVVRVYTLRHEDGTPAAGVVEFDINFRFPGEATFTGLHIHDGAAGVNGPVTVNTGLSAAAPVRTETGFGNIHRFVNVGDGTALATLNSLVRNPENHYVNLHTTVNPGGAIRAQVAPPNTALPVVSNVVAANLDTTATTLAPGSLISIFGTNLAKVTADLSGWEGAVLPEMLNGVAIAVGPHRARLLYVSPRQVNAVVPLEISPGQTTLAVNNGNGPGAGFPVRVAAAAPALFFGPDGALAVNSTRGELIGPGTPARAGDVVLLYATGLGQTIPPLNTGALAPASPVSNTVPVTVTIGGQNADVISSVAAPGYAGLYQLAVRVPANVAAGNAPVVVRAGGAASAQVGLAVR